MCVKSSERQMMKVMDLILLLMEEILHELQVSHHVLTDRQGAGALGIAS